MNNIPKNYPKLYVSYLDVITGRHLICLSGFESESFYKKVSSTFKSYEVTKNATGGIWKNFEHITASIYFNNSYDQQMFLQELINIKVPFVNNNNSIDPVSEIIDMKNKSVIYGIINIVSIIVSDVILIKYSTD